MATGNRAYKQQVFNESGYVLLYPNIGSETDLLQSYPPDPFEISATQQFPLGTKLIQGERVWRYSLNGGVALVPGYTVQSIPSVSAGHDMDMVTAAAAVDALAVTITPATVSFTKDLYKEGYLFTNDLAGEGQCLKIKSHPAITFTETGVITLYDPVKLALTSSTLTGIRKNPYSGLVVTPHTTLTGMVVGVCDIPVTANYYFWVQTGGPCACHTMGTLVLGGSITGDTTAGSVPGAVGPFTSVGTEQNLGTVMNVSVTTQKSLIFLTIDR